MQIQGFDIRNFRGIKETKIELGSGRPGNVVTLIGLNESGKTTILEAMSHFVTKDAETETLIDTVQRKSDMQSLIPKDKKAAFTGSVSIKCGIVIEEDDKSKLIEHLSATRSIRVDPDTMPTKIEVDRSHRFEDSAYAESNNFWTGLLFYYTDPEGIRTQCTYTGDTRAIWLDAVAFLSRRIPRIVYFPTFLFDFPDRIYLEEIADSDQATLDVYYRRVMQDVLDSQGEGLALEKHVVDRIKRLREKHTDFASFFAFLLGTDEKSQIDSVLQKLSNEISKRVFGAWKEVLGRSVNNKRIQVDWLVDATKGNAPYLQLFIIDGQSKFSLSERSLGFRWFFSFLLFTEFRSNRHHGGETIFVFDEPAANLHSKAQIKLLESFSRIASGKTYVVYSTHSHYMVNTNWLEKAYIITNSAIDFEDIDEVDAFTVRSTDINAVRYRSFVSNNPTKTTYFQPVLDALEAPVSPLMSSSRALIVEGKSDYFAIRYFTERAKPKPSYNIFPANGAGNAGPLINLFRGWGVDFRVLLDGDKAGQRAKDKYIKEFGVSPNDIVTLKDIFPTLKANSIEGLYGEDARALLQSSFPETGFSKTDFSLMFQELAVRKEPDSLPETEKKFGVISAWLAETFKVKPS